MKTLLRGYPRVSARQFYCWSNVLDVGLGFYRGCVNVPFFIKNNGIPLALVREWCPILYVQGSTPFNTKVTMCSCV